MIAKVCHRHRKLVSAGQRCPECATNKRVRLDAHRNPQGQAFRRFILQRDGYRCHWCEGRATSVDYLVALVDGGTALDAGNAVASCRSCNSRRGAAIVNGVA